VEVGVPLAFASCSVKVRPVSEEQLESAIQHSKQASGGVKWSIPSGNLCHSTVIGITTWVTAALFSTYLIVKLTSAVH